MCPDAKLSKPVPDFEGDLAAFVEQYTSLWHRVAADAPVAEVTFTSHAQEHNEHRTDQLIEGMERALRNYPATRQRQAAWRERMFQLLRGIGTESFRFPDRHFDIIFSPAYFSSTRNFARQARAFDPRIQTAALGQAMRNVWVMNCLQMFAGRRPSVSPSVFAYSMLYPYTDNPLDEPGRPQACKEIECRRLALRLSGGFIAPEDEHEAAVFRLVAMIEEEYPRGSFPEVYASLLAIHAAQVKSLNQQHKSRPPETPKLLEISVGKGGSSVLADGWLAAGNLSRLESRFVFGFGVMLQLLDDLQDLADDRKAGHWTLFTRAASMEPLDHLTSRLWHFTHTVMNDRGCFADSRGLELRDLILRNSMMLLLRSMAENADLYSEVYLRHMERFSPLRFGYLRNRRRSLEAKFASIWPAIAKKHNLASIFDLL